MIKKVAIIGSHGLYANYGGWDQLVKNLAEKKSGNVEYLIFNSKESPKVKVEIPGVTVKHLNINASGFQGLFYDFWSILICFRRVDTLLLLGVQGIPLVPVLSLFKKFKVVSNVGGIEWERPKFGFFSKLYLKWCFELSFLYSSSVILDNEHYKTFIPKKVISEVHVIPYGGEIDRSMNISDELVSKYPFLTDDYYLSISRSLEDNQLEELCFAFSKSNHKLVLISNFSNSDYGNKVYNKFKEYNNIVLVNGLYHKPELDLVRRSAKAYIHTHTLCGTAPSLVEMIVAQIPVFSFDIPQNRFTLAGQGCFFSDFEQLLYLLDQEEYINSYLPSSDLSELYSWDKIVHKYESLY